jgi:hypothetical protein
MLGWLDVSSGASTVARLDVSSGALLRLILHSVRGLAEVCLLTKTSKGAGVNLQLGGSPD